MTDAELIYNAGLRAERRIEEKANAEPAGSPQRSFYLSALLAVTTLREEIGKGIVEVYPS